MAATKAKGPNKSAFIRELLRRNPETNLKAVNAAWKKAGHSGSISNPLFYQAKPRQNTTSTKGSANGATARNLIENAPKAPATTKRGPKKLAFIRELLGRNPELKLKAVNEAWTKAGHKGSISSTSLYLVKSQTNSTSAKGSASGATPGNAAPTKSTSRTTTQAQPGHQPASERDASSESNGGVLDDLEVEIDGLIFKLMDVGGMSHVEEALRRARRLIVRQHG
jgi:hypothetical protein